MIALAPMVFPNSMLRLGVSLIVKVEFWVKLIACKSLAHNAGYMVRDRSDRELSAVESAELQNNASLSTFLVCKF